MKLRFRTLSKTDSHFMNNFLILQPSENITCLLVKIHTQLIGQILGFLSVRFSKISVHQTDFNSFSDQIALKSLLIRNSKSKFWIQNLFAFMQKSHNLKLIRRMEIFSYPASNLSYLFSTTIFYQLITSLDLEIPSLEPWPV